MVKSKEQFWVLLLLVLTFGLIGVIFLSIGIGLYIRGCNKRRTCTKSVMATVVDMRNESVGTGDFSAGGETVLKSWFPIYEFTIGGVQKRAKAPIGTATPTLKVGQTVELLVNPDRTEEFYCPTEQVSGIQKVFIGVGVVCVCLAVMMGTALCVSV